MASNDPSSFQTAGKGREPDRSKSDYYCRICDSHMNSAQMWESHISGKRHIKNIKKEPGEPPSKIKTVKRDDLTPYLFRILEDIEEPIVGLSYMCELRKTDLTLDPIFTCYLCHGNFTGSNVIDHVISSKHRLNYIKEVDNSTYAMIENLQLKKTALDCLTEERAEEYEKLHGRGHPEVKVEIAKYPSLPPLRKVPKAGSSRMDIDTASESAASPDNQGACAASPESPRGIEDIDILRDINMMSMEMKLEVLSNMINDSPMPVRTEEQAKIMLHTLRMVGRSLMHCRFRHMPEDVMQRLYDDLTNPDDSRAYSSILGFKEHLL